MKRLPLELWSGVIAPFPCPKDLVNASLYGARRIAAAISEDNALAQYLGEIVEKAEDLNARAAGVNICCFRYVPLSLRPRTGGLGKDKDEGRNSQLNELNSRIMNAIQRGGRAYVSSATLRGKFALRACITNFRTTRADIDQTLEIIRDAARQVDKGFATETLRHRETEE